MQQRANIVLLAAQGWQNKDIAAEVDLDRRQVALWRERFLDGGVEALMHDAPRPGRTPSVTTPEFESSIVDKTLHDRPIAATHWSTRTLAAQLGVGPTTIRRVWQRNGLKPPSSIRIRCPRNRVNFKIPLFVFALTAIPMGIGAILLTRSWRFEDLAPPP